MIRLDFGTLEQVDLLKLANSALKTCETWQVPIWEFVIAYFDKSDYIEVNTSGSTGKPKSIHLRKEYMLNSALATGKYFDFKQGQVALLGMSCNFIGGKMMLLRAILFKMKLLLLEPQANLFQYVHTPIDFVPMVPLQLQAAIEAGVEFSGIKNILLGGAAISTVLENQIQQLPSRVFASYGMTETISHIAIREVNGPNASAWFTPFENIELDLDDRNCLIINAPQLSDSIIVTNDIVELTTQNQDVKFKILGRYDLIINSGGLKINPEQLEEKLAELFHPKKIIITAAPDVRLGQKIILLVEGAKDDSINWLEKIKPILSKYELPKQIFYLPAFVYTESGKINRVATTKLILTN